MGKGFRLILAVVAISICAGGVIGGGQPASAGEMTPETEKLFRAVRSNDFPAVKRNLLDGGDVRAENAAGLTVIDLAIDKGYFNIAHYLLAWRKQRKPKAKLPLPLPAPPSITAEAAPTAEPAFREPAREEAPKAEPSPAGQAREAAPIAPQPAEPLPGAESAAKPTPTPIETATRPEPLPQTDPVTRPAEKTAEKAAEIPPSAPTSEPPRPEAAATEPSGNKILTSAPEESPGILDRITGYFTSDPEPENSARAKDQPDPEPKAPAPKPMGSVTPPAEKTAEKAAEIPPSAPTSEPPRPEAAATEPSGNKILTSAPEESPGILDRITGYFTSDPEPENSARAKDQPDPEPKAPAPKPMVEESPAAAEKAAEDKPGTPAEQAAAASAIAAQEEEKAPEGPGVFDQIARFFSPETGPRDDSASQSEAKPQPAAKAVVEETPRLTHENTPPGEPVREAAENPTPLAPEKPEDRSDIIARIQGMLSIGPEKEAPPASRPEETASIPTSAPAPRPMAEPTPPPGPAVQPSAAPKSTTIEPFIGTSMKLGKRWQKDTENTCVDKPSKNSLFCIEPVDWPPGIGPSFQVHTTLYRGRKSIVRYEGGVATQFHTLFPTGNFDVIVEHFSKLLGPPTEKPVIWTVMIGKPNRKNRTARWVGPQRAGGKNGDQGAAPGILDVREIDDLRWSSPPDDRHGVVWLYRQGGLPVFRNVSWSDFLLARVRRQRK